MIKLGQVAEQPGKTGIVCPRTDQAHGKDSVPGDGRVCVVRELGECVQNAELGVGGRDEGQGKGNGPPNDWFAVTQLKETNDSCTKW